MNELKGLVREAADFAAQNIATRAGLSSSTIFPVDLWHELGSSGLLGIGVPREFGGQGLGYTGIFVAGRALARNGHCLGITLSWLMHQITAQFFVSSFGSVDQKLTILPGMARGAITTSIAISEPGVGGHPKHLKTAAVKSDGGYTLTGEKQYLTNGPIADAFIVLAVSGRGSGRKRFSAFIVPRHTPGLVVSEPVDFGFLRPCQHCGIILNGCRVNEGDMIGRPDIAYDAMALPFRDIEDTAMMGPVLGAQEARLDEIVKGLKEKNAPLSDDTMMRLGGISSDLSALDALAFEAARRLDNGDDPAGSTALVLAFRRLCRRVNTDIDDVFPTLTISAPEAYLGLSDDISHIVRFAERVNNIKQMKLGISLVEDL